MGLDSAGFVVASGVDGTPVLADCRGLVCFGLAVVPVTVSPTIRRQHAGHLMREQRIALYESL
jgi:hypothetical protein